MTLDDQASLVSRRGQYGDQLAILCRQRAPDPAQCFRVAEPCDGIEPAWTKLFAAERRPTAEQPLRAAIVC